MSLPVRSPLLQQLLDAADKQQQQQSANTDAARSAPVSVPGIDFTAEEVAQIKQLVASSSPALQAALNSSTSASDLAERIRPLLRAATAAPNTALNSASVSQTSSESSINSQSSSSAATGVTSTSSSTPAPSSSSASSASLSAFASSSTPLSYTSPATMDVEHQQPATAAGPSAAAAAAAGSPLCSSMEVDSGGDSSFLRVQLKSITMTQKGASTSAEGVLRHLLKMLSALKKSPNLLATRKFRADNIAVKKFVVEVPGALEIAKYVGYNAVELTEKKVPYLLIEESAVSRPDNKQKLDEAIEALTAAVAVYDTPAGAAPAPAAPAVRMPCKGDGCSFFGSSDTEGYCSVCFKKKFLASPAKPVHTNPFQTPPKGASTAVAASAAASSSPSAAKPGEPKCPKNCGHAAGGAATKGFCKQCYDKITAQGAKPPKRWRCCLVNALTKLRAVHRFNLGKKPVQLNKNRCWVCSKKLGITGFECRCRYVFCAAHRYMEQHECSYDIKSLHRKKLKRENEEIRAAKIVKL